MISDAILFFNVNQYVITFITHLCIFLGGSYVALHCRFLPQWLVAPIWYTGLFASLTVISILLQWGIGPEFPLSYWNLGQLTESLVDISTAFMAVILLINTLKKDIDGSKKRNNKSE